MFFHYLMQCTRAASISRAFENICLYYTSCHSITQTKRDATYRARQYNLVYFVSLPSKNNKNNASQRHYYALLNAIYLLKYMYLI